MLFDSEDLQILKGNIDGFGGIFGMIKGMERSLLPQNYVHTILDIQNRVLISIELTVLLYPP